MSFWPQLPYGCSPHWRNPTVSFTGTTNAASVSAGALSYRMLFSAQNMPFFSQSLLKLHWLSHKPTPSTVLPWSYCEAPSWQGKNQPSNGGCNLPAIFQGSLKAETPSLWDRSSCLALSFWEREMVKVCHRIHRQLNMAGWQCFPQLGKVLLTVILGQQAWNGSREAHQERDKGQASRPVSP